MLIANFNSVLEVAFAVNFVLYAFTLRPQIFRTWKGIPGREKIANVWRPVSSDDPSLAPSSPNYVERDQFLLAIARAMDVAVVVDKMMIWSTSISSVTALSALVLAAFVPNVTLPTWVITPFLIFFFVLPLFGSFFLWGIVPLLHKIYDDHENAKKAPHE